MACCGKRQIPGCHPRRPIHRQTPLGLMIQLLSATSDSIRRLLGSNSSKTPPLLSARITPLRTALTAACSRLASTAARSRTPPASFFKAVTTARSARVAAIRWQAARRGLAVLADLSQQLWGCRRDTPPRYGGEWAATTAVPVRAGESTLSRHSVRGPRRHRHPQ
jgi:hypothetical protein